DLRYEGPRQPADTAPRRPAAPGAPAVDEEEGGGRFAFNNGPFVMPGEYTATLRANDKTLTTKIQVRADPRVAVTLADLKEQHDVALAIRDLTSRANTLLEDRKSTRRTPVTW